MDEEDSSSKARAQAWCWTSFSVDTPPVFDSDVMQYLCWGPEICPETQRPHLQGFVFFHSNKRQHLKGCVRYLTKGVHVAIKKGTLDQAIDYCKGPWESSDKKHSKPLNSSFVEFGDRPAQGKRTDLVILKNRLVAGETTVGKIILDDPYAFHNNGRTLEAIAREIERSIPARNFQPQVFWHFGTTETGKTYDVLKFCDEHKLTRYKYHFTKHNSWQDGYKNQDVIWLDEFRGGHLEWQQLLDLTGRNQQQFDRRRDGLIENTSKYIFITSPMPPWEIYTHRQNDSMLQFLRRITELRRYCLYEDGSGYEVIDTKIYMDNRPRVKRDGSQALETHKRLREVLGIDEDADIVGDIPEDERPARKRFFPAYT